MPRVVRCWGPKGENSKENAQSGQGFLGRAQEASFHQLVRLGERCKLPSGVRAGAKPQVHFGHIKSQENASSGCKYRLFPAKTTLATAKDIVLSRDVSHFGPGARRPPAPL